MRHYHDIESYNIQLKSDIAVTRTETFTAEENVANLEKIKKKQDLLIDSMNEEIKRLEEQKNILAAQLVSQHDETEEAKKVLREAQLEMGRIIASKKNLLDRWQRSLTDMQRMDEALQDLRESLKEQEERNILLKTELNGIRSEIRKEEGTTEKVTMHANRLAN
jgi:chromosome segregation ATPase